MALNSLSRSVGSRPPWMPSCLRMLRKTSRQSLCMGLWMGCAACGQAQTPPIPGDWVLEFEDNFDGTQLDGTQLDGTKWKVGQHWEGINGTGGNSPANITVSGGTLNLRSEQRPVTLSGVNYSYATGDTRT